MPGISTGLAVGLGVSAAGSVAGGLLAKSGAESQASAAERSSAAAVAEQRRQFDITQKNLAPWLAAGTQSIQTLQFLLGLGVPPNQAAQMVSEAPGSAGGRPDISPMLARLRQFDGGGPPSRFFNEGSGDFERGGFAGALPSRTGAPKSNVPAGFSAGDFGSLTRDFSTADFQTDPGYEFRLSEGIKALERSAAARGTTFSGGTQKELARYNQDFASNEFTNAYNRFQQNRATRFNQLAAISGVGQTTAAQLGNFGAQNASNIGNLIVGGQTAAAAARASGYGALGGAIQGAANLPLNWLLLSRLNAQPSAGAIGV